jgi:hypothetical protein
MVTSDSVLDAFLSMSATDYRGTLRTIVAAANPQMSEEEIRERVNRQVAYQPHETAVVRWRAWAEDDATDAGRACGDRLWLLYSEDMSGGWFPAGEEGRRLARRLFPDAHVEEIEDGMISRPDLVGAVLRRVTSKAPAATT